MAALKAVPVTLPEDKIPSKAMVRDIIGTFLTKEWPSIDPDTLTMLHHASYANAHCRVERPKPVTESFEPLKVFIKFHNGNSQDIKLFRDLVPSKSEEALLCYEYGQSGLGAQVYGFFQTQDGSLGRIDEFLDARNMEPEDVEDATIRADVAKGLATFHAMKISLENKPVEQFYDYLLAGLHKYHKMDKPKQLAKEGGIDMDRLVDYDFGTRLRKVAGKLESIQGRKGWCIHDVQFMNVMVKNQPQEGDSRVVLIDFEFVMQNYRAFDMGGHFMQKMFKWFDEENKIASCRKYTDDEKRHFCEEYAKQWNSITGDVDTGEQLFMESEYGYMLAITFDIHNMLCFMCEVEDKDPLNLLGLNKLFDEFVSQYAKLGLEDS
ncbi:hypothetical protein QQS21_003265 [Conoideocrella luteorostrata]|uniref:Choline/ethanolamine kinase n=1 Tax=Conoideocrella luteorostrata TaxID=1105319 RepID=A0AAJ0G0R0_9HYPO|nr:hypothetical protein QQS21_003265 [Conoideocrella luteorostrata]